MFKFHGFINLKSLVKSFVADPAAVAAVNQHEALAAPRLPLTRASMPERTADFKVKPNRGIQVFLKCTVKTDMQNLYRAIKYASYENCEFVETVRRGENCELTIKTDDFSVTRQVGGVIKDLTGCPVTGVINTPTTRILLQF